MAVLFITHEIVGEGLLVHDIGDPAGRDQSIADTLREVGLDPEERHRYPNEFSGGPGQRIALARALVRSLCHEIVIMRRGEIVEAGPAREIFARQQHPYTRELLATAFAS